MPDDRAVMNLDHLHGLTRDFLDSPRAGEQAPLELLWRVADQHAHEVWGERIARGPAIPLHDARGQLHAYLFSYARHGGSHPEMPELAELADATGDTSDNGRADVRFAEGYGSVTVSTHRDAPPVLRASNYLHPLFASAQRARQEAARFLDRPPAELQPARAFFLGLHAEYLEFCCDDQSVVVNLTSFAPRRLEEFKMAFGDARPPSPEEVELSRSRWDMALRFEPPVIHAPRLHEAGTMPYWELIPIINWTWWCVPTAFAMVLGYWDNYVKGVGVNTGYGRLVKYWYDHPKFKNNVPEFMDQLIDPATGTWRTGFTGLGDFVNKTYGYPFTKDDVAANQSNDWAWAEIKAEIDAGRPLVWATGHYGSPHATTAFGYATRSAGKFVKLLTTWGHTAAAQRDEVVHTACTGIGRVVPHGGDPAEHVVLEGPRGGETVIVGMPTPITWFVWGQRIKSIDLFASYDGGLSWSATAKGLPAAPGSGSGLWTPQKPTTNARVRLEGRDSSGGLVAADGSRNNFKVSSCIYMTTKKSAKVVGSVHP